MDGNGIEYENYFNLSYQSQLLVGLLESVNHFTVSRPKTDKLVYIAHNRLNILLNCNEKSKKSIKSYSSGTDIEEFQFSLM